MTAFSYRDAWNFLDQLQFFKIKLGLDSMNRFLESLDQPHNCFPALHIAGTNGKGSVGVTLLTLLQEAGHTIGFYTSPHLSSVRERFRIGNEYISRTDFARLAERIIGILHGRRITYFEFTTALAMLWFAERKVDLAVLEVGLGGRLDATNVITPLVSIITNVSMDHEQYLGSTIGEVAAEKAGIIKPGIPVVSGAADPQAMAVITAAAARQGSPLNFLNRDFSGRQDPSDNGLWSYTGLHFPDKAQKTFSGLPIAIRGCHQVNNSALALAALELISDRFSVREETIRSGLKHVAWPGRLEEFRLDHGRLHYLLDGAHNPDGARALRAALEHDFACERLILIWACMADKDMRATLQEIAPLADILIFTRPESERSARPEQLADLLPDDLRHRARCTTSVEAALALAEKEYRPGDMICVAGSLYLVGRARRLLLGSLVEEEDL